MPGDFGAVQLSHCVGSHQGHRIASLQKRVKESRSLQTTHLRGTEVVALGALVACRLRAKLAQERASPLRERTFLVSRRVVDAR